MTERKTRPSDEAICRLEKAAWDANVDGVLVWERDERQRVINERDLYRGTLVGTLSLLNDHPVATKRINQALAAPAPAPPPTPEREREQKPIVVRTDDLGVDEVVGRGSIHLECMSDSTFWLLVSGDAGDEVQLSIGAVRAIVRARLDVHQESAPPAPLSAQEPETSGHRLRWTTARFGLMKAHCVCGAECSDRTPDAVQRWFDQHLKSAAPARETALRKALIAYREAHGNCGHDDERCDLCVKADAALGHPTGWPMQPAALSATEDK